MGKCPIFQRECKVLLQKDELGVKKPTSALIEQIEGFITFYFEGHIGHFRWDGGVAQLHKFSELS